jgi:putative tryptophan/tyrosine transport system substrate-binding protein
MLDVRRREFIARLGVAACAAWPVASYPQSAKRPTVGFFGTSSPSLWTQWTASFVQRLRELGWVEGHTIGITYRWAEGYSKRYAEIAAEMVKLNVDVIVTSGTGVGAAKDATATIPIVFAVAVDPVGSGFVSSLARPGGNVTGLSIQSPDLVGKRIELLREIKPSLHRLAILANGAYPAAMLEMEEVASAALALNLEVVRAKVSRADEFAPAFETFAGADALYVVGESFINTHRVRINTLALVARLPIICAFREFAEAGSVLTYGASYPHMFRRTAEIVDKLLRGAKPADIPVEQPTKFDLIINLVTAKALGLNVPTTLLARADEVIE